uniref:Small ribosomal subunit protein mS40 n=1 Tax=Ciona intestinalis TaxID=7719 RepID=F6VP33_CIOIN|nr:28S ribosomal protein S18b, mitochondrial-like [Ciona intestinalis]XP_026693609.1 28S ribosomal protein S18b, mitochondrial-like [Ciona intestinalis]|eukprot:XP_002129978.1 28S ribosomal protein S18b, mitochondrial-like [Ciona intestinalis]
MSIRTSIYAINALKRTSQFNCARKIENSRCFHSKPLTLAMWGEKFNQFKPQVEAEDSNDRALRELDVTLLKPHPEWRNSAAGPIWPKDYHKLLWEKWEKNLHFKQDKVEQDKDWENYCEENGFSPQEYLETADFRTLYGERLIWENYVRNFKGGVQPQQTRSNCFRKGEMSTGSPCPLCRDEKIMVTYNNLPLLHHFIDKQTGQLYSNLRTGACRFKHRRLVKAFSMAKDFGYLAAEAEFVKYDLTDHRVNYSAL